MVIVVAGLMATATGTPISDDCSARFHKSLTEVLQLKKTCATAMYKDCWPGNMHAHMHIII